MAESVAIAAPIAAVIFFAGGGAAVAAGLDAIATVGLDTAAVIAPSIAAEEAGAASTVVFGEAIWGATATGARAFMGVRTAAQLRALGLTPRLACGLRNFYRVATVSGRAGEAAPARAELMQHILETLIKGSFGRG